MLVGIVTTPEKGGHIMITQHSFSSLKARVSSSKFFQIYSPRSRPKTIKTYTEVVLSRGKSQCTKPSSFIMDIK